MNYFAPKNAAERYAVGRPDFHQNTINKVANYLNIHEKLPIALDIACGTGLSTKALLPIANQVFATDISDEMLLLAYPNSAITYQKMSAENLDFLSESIDLITVSSGVHWFDIDRFLQEAHRVLRPNAHIVLYENYFISKMENTPAFDAFFSKYLEKYPSPPRNNDYNWRTENLISKGLMMTNEDEFENPIVFTKAELILYFTTQSNITAAVEQGNTTYEDVEAWLNEALKPFFETENTLKTIFYGNWIKYLKRIT
jgi:ubiquinone/menaquinone biosynthesis C-methylase UbiE